MGHHLRLQTLHHQFGPPYFVLQQTLIYETFWPLCKDHLIPLSIVLSMCLASRHDLVTEVNCPAPVFHSWSCSKSKSFCILKALVIFKYACFSLLPMQPRNFALLDRWVCHPWKIYPISATHFSSKPLVRMCYGEWYVNSLFFKKRHFFNLAWPLPSSKGFLCEYWLEMSTTTLLPDLAKQVR